MALLLVIASIGDSVETATGGMSFDQRRWDETEPAQRMAMAGEIVDALLAGRISFVENQGASKSYREFVKAWTNAPVLPVDAHVVDRLASLAKYKEDNRWSELWRCLSSNYVHVKFMGLQAFVWAG